MLKIIGMARSSWPVAELAEGRRKVILVA